MSAPDICIVKHLYCRGIHCISRYQCSHGRDTCRYRSAIIYFRIGNCCYCQWCLGNYTCCRIISDIVVCCYILTGSTFLYRQTRSGHYMCIPYIGIVVYLDWFGIHHITGNQCPCSGWNN